MYVGVSMAAVNMTLHATAAGAQHWFTGANKPLNHTTAPHQHIAIRQCGANAVPLRFDAILSICWFGVVGGGTVASRAAIAASRAARRTRSSVASRWARSRVSWVCESVIGLPQCIQNDGHTRYSFSSSLPGVDHLGALCVSAVRKKSRCRPTRHSPPPRPPATGALLPGLRLRPVARSTPAAAPGW